MANKRVSMKGRGADLFFGDYTPSDATGAVDPGDADKVVTESPPPVVASVADEVVESEPIALVKLPAMKRAFPSDDENGPANRSAARSRVSARARVYEQELSGKNASKQADSVVPALACSPARTHPSESAFELASTLATTTEAVEAIRRAVREPGREVAYVRLTPEEKGLVGDIVHAYKKRGQRTTENEVHRIAINHLLQDYHEQGEASVLARVLASLRA